MAGDYNLGIARGLIEVGFRDLGVDKAVAALDTVSAAAETVGNVVKTTGKTMATAGAAIAFGLGMATKTAAAFEERLSAVKAVSGATGSEMDTLRDKALQLGADTAFTAGDAAGAMEELVKAGLSVESVLNGAADATVNLAAAGGVSLPEAATIAANAMNQFGLAAQDLPKVADSIAGAANASAISVGEFGFSLSQVGAVANLAGQSFEDTAVAIALMGNAGIKGSDAGTSLKTMFQSLNPSTLKQINLFKELGIVTADGSNKLQDAQGNFKGLADISEVLNQAFGFSTLSTKEFNEAVKAGVDPLDLLKDSANKTGKAQQLLQLETAFGSDAIRAAAILAHNGATGFDAMAASMDKVKAADVAKTRMDNLNGAIEQLKGSFDSAMISVGTTFLPMMKMLTKALTKVVNVFNGLPGPVKTTIAIFAGLVAVLLAVGGAMLFLLPILIAAIANFILLRVIGSIVSVLRLYIAASKGATTWTAAHAAAQRVLGTAITRTTLLTKVLVKSLRLLALTWKFMMGPIGIVIAAIAAVGITIFAMTRKSKPEIEDLTQAFMENSDAMDQNTRSVMADRLEKEGLLELGQKLGVNLADLTAASLGDVAARDKVNASLDVAQTKMLEYLNTLSGSPDEMESMAKAAGVSVEEIDKLRNAMNGQTGATKLAMEAVLRNKEATAKSAGETGKATTAEDRLNEAVGRAPAKYHAAAAGADKLKDGVKDVAKETEDAEKRVDDFNKALKDLFDVAFGSDRAMDAFQSKINDLKDLVKDNGTALKGESDKAIANREALRSTVESIGDVIQPLLDKGELSQTQIIARVNTMRKKFVDAAVGKGFDRKELETKFTEMLKKIPTLFELTMQVDGVAEAKEKVDGLRAEMEKLEKPVIGPVDVKGDAEAKEKVRSLQAQINSLVGKYPELGVTGVDGAIVKVDSLQAHIDAMRGKVINLDVQAETKAFQTKGFATGGIVSRATRALVGEAGPEAIMPLPDLAKSFLRIFEAGQTLPRQVTAASARESGATKVESSSGGSRLVSGRLSIDKSGHAFIRGVAEDVVDGNDQFAATYERMG